MDRWMERGEMRGKSERRKEGEGEDMVSTLFKTIQGKKPTGETSDQWRDQ